MTHSRGFWWDTCSQHVLGPITWQRKEVEDANTCTDHSVNTDHNFPTPHYKQYGERRTERAKTFCHVGTITDLCNNLCTPEVEIHSLMKDDTPIYKLRVDTVTEFVGYKNNDWIQTPVLPKDTDLNLNPEFLTGLFAYFLSCGDRLSQMTKTYNDIDAVRALLEEKERDLELAAYIGQSLLDQNKQLIQRSECLEKDLANANGTICQLKRDLATKVGLLQIYTEDLDMYSETTTDVGQEVHDWDHLLENVHRLKEKNNQLRSEVDLQEAALEQEEEREIHVLNDIVKELTESRKLIVKLQEELDKMSDSSCRQEEMTSLLCEVVELKQEVRSLITENGVLQETLQTSQEECSALLNERTELREKYSELVTAFHEVQEENRKMNRTRLPSAKRWKFNMYTSCVNTRSLASELDSSFGRDGEGYGSDDKLSRSKRVFQTVKYARKPKSSRPRSTTLQHLQCTPHRQRTRSSMSLSYLSSSSSGFNDSFTSDSESVYAESCLTDDESHEYSSVASLGRPGAPGSSDFDTALSRLDVQEDPNFLTRTEVGEDEMAKSDVAEYKIMESNCYWSTNFEMYRIPMASFQGNRHYHRPEKLQIIKPLEGSQTLHQWKRLATPHLGGIFETRSGIQIKGAVHVPDLEPENFTLSDLEEDEVYYQPGKSFVQTPFTNSTFLHPLNQNQMLSSFSTCETQEVENKEPESIEVQHVSHRKIDNTQTGLKIQLQDQNIHAVLSFSKSSGSSEVVEPGLCSSTLTPIFPRYVLFPTMITYDTGNINRKPSQKSSTPTTNVHTTPTMLNSVFPVLSPVELMERLNAVGTTENHIPAIGTRHIPRCYIPCYHGFFNITTVSDHSPLTLTNGQESEKLDIRKCSNMGTEDEKPESICKCHDKHNTICFHSWGKIQTKDFRHFLPFLCKPYFQICLGIIGSSLGSFNIFHTQRKGGFT
ncbi:trafficking kinesin-binding protein 1-like isoform X4 [Tachypleus tridentatus]|uniref:trafficking kinesin-binding protein 1-like isoform X4 n=1 Tax=Tachypleus tridentatus TaxID=6853 RepID=UPI003FD03D2E